MIPAALIRPFSRAAIAVSALILLAFGGETAAQPAAGDAHDLSGVWFIDMTNYKISFDPVEGGDPPYTAQSRAIVERRLRAYNAGKAEVEPNNRCRPHGVPRVMMSPYPIQIVQTPGQVTILHEVAHLVRYIYMDDPPPPKTPLLYMGRSTGRWDGDTLVVETTGLRDDTWIDEVGKPHSDALRVVERFTKSADGKEMELVITIDDPKAYTRPWSVRRIFKKRDDLRLTEYICEEGLEDEAR